MTKNPAHSLPEAVFNEEPKEKERVQELKAGFEYLLAGVGAPVPCGDLQKGSIAARRAAPTLPMALSYHFLRALDLFLPSCPLRQ
jgi:hypothetical protein